MKYYKYSFILTVFFSLFLLGCDKYLNIAPKGKTLLTTVSNYDQWLNDPMLDLGPVGLPGGQYCTLNYFGDNYDYPSVNVPAINSGDFTYTWASQFSTDLNASPLFWSDHYAKMNKFNTLLLGIDNATEGTVQQRKSLKAEALLGRALEYFYLVNEYGNAYDSTTADKDLAVPFVTSNDVTQKVPSRSTVKEVYDHIISDLNAAIPDLPLDNSANRFRGSVAAAYSVLARVYFYAGDYVDAKANAVLALAKGKATMMNFNGTLPTTSLLSIQSDVIYGRRVIGSNTPTLDFMRSFTINDLRVKKLYTSTDNYTFSVRGATLFFPNNITPGLLYVNTGTSIQEMKLIIAEAAARSGDLTTALQQLDDIRTNRIQASSYVKFQSNNQASVLQAVLGERSNELPFSGLRWFDMRRLDKEGKMNTVYRYDANGNVIATLAPHSPRYTLQIPIQVLAFNPNMQQNP
jgi:hypothetical protein